jgi:hypothetical protein
MCSLSSFFQVFLHIQKVKNNLLAASHMTMNEYLKMISLADGWHIIWSSPRKGFGFKGDDFKV